MLLAMIAVQLVVMIVLPVALMIVACRALRVTWWVPIVGAFGWIGSQVVHMPLLMASTAGFRDGWLPAPPDSWAPWFNPVVLGLAAAACEEPARWIVFRFVMRERRDAANALASGLGHGGVESILFGVLAALGALNAFVMRDLSADALVALGTPEAQATLAVEQVRAFWAAPWYSPLLAGYERLVSITFHVSASMLVAHAVRTRNAWPVLLAMAFHAITDGLAVWAVGALGMELTELALLATVPISAAIIVWMWRAGRPDHSSDGGGSSGADESLAAQRPSKQRQPPPQSIVP